MSADLEAMHAQVGAIGRELNADSAQRTRDLFAAQHEREPYSGVSVRRDIRYGADERHRLDLFTADAAPGSAADGTQVLLFVHGGGYSRGDKHLPGTPYNDNVALFAVRSGMIGATMNYRLAPDHRHPAGAEDVAAAAHWLRATLTSESGVPPRIFLMGTSAGASHVASAVDFCGDAIAGVILLSGLFDARNAALRDVLDVYYGDGSTVARTPGEVVLASAVPVLAVCTEYDPPLFVAETEALVAALEKRPSGSCRLLRLEGHNHFSGALQLNGTDRRFADAIVAFCA